MGQSSVIKVYLPMEADGEYLYGFKKIEKAEADLTITSYFVISYAKTEVKNTDLELLGTIGGQLMLQDGIKLLKDREGKIFKVMQNGKNISSNNRVLLLRFDAKQFLKTHEEYYEPKTVEGNFALFIAKALKSEHDKKNGKSIVSRVSTKSHSFLATSSSIASKVFQSFTPLFKNTVIYQHCCNWQKCLHDERSQNGFFVLDVLLGVLFFLLMNHVQHSGRYFMGSTEFIVQKLRKLLEMLDGESIAIQVDRFLNKFISRFTSWVEAQRAAEQLPFKLLYVSRG